jgi:uncharacterized protein YpiB (UPF0302 family)
MLVDTKESLHDLRLAHKQVLYLKLVPVLQLMPP